MNIPILDFRQVMQGGTLVTTFDKRHLNLYQESVIRSKLKDLVIYNKDDDSKCSLHFIGELRNVKPEEEIFYYFGYTKIFDIEDFWKVFDQLKNLEN